MYCKYICKCLQSHVHGTRDFSGMLIPGPASLVASSRDQFQIEQESSIPSRARFPYKRGWLTPIPCQSTKGGALINAPPGRVFVYIFVFTLHCTLLRIYLMFK